MLRLSSTLRPALFVLSPFGHDCNCVNFHKELRPAQSGLDTSAGGEGIETQFGVKVVSDRVEFGVVPEIDEVAGGADDIVPIGPFTGQ